MAPRHALISVLVSGLVATLAMGCSGDAAAPVGPIVEVTIANTTFTPDAVRVLRGGSVRWTNTSATERHNIIASTPGSFEDHADLLAPGESATITFTKSGTYAYYCQLHGAPDRGQRGTIVVMAGP